MSWNYRVYLFETPIEDDTHVDADRVEQWFEIRETYYEDDGTTPRAWSEEANGVAGDDLLGMLDRMREALAKPVLDSETGQEVGDYYEILAEMDDN
jgi:hypothetical protein